MDITFSANNGEETITLPVIPPELACSNANKNTTFESIDQDLNLIGNCSLLEINFSSIFPVNKNYSFAKTSSFKDGWRYMDFFKKWSKKKVPLRFVVTDGLNEIYNLAVTIESLEYSIDRVKDIRYTLKLKEYIFVN